MEDFLFTPIVILLGLAVHAVVLRLHETAEGKILTFSFGGHVASGFLQMVLVLYYYPGGDMLGYLGDGIVIAEVLKSDFFEWLPEVAAVFFQQPDRLPVEFYRAGTTGSMTALSSLVMLAVGASPYAACQLVALAAYLSNVLAYRALRTWLAPVAKLPLLWGLATLPSAVFWSSCLLKEPIVFCALGPLLLALSWLAAAKRRTAAVLLLVPSAVVISVIKPYVLIAFSLAAGVFYLVTRGRAQVAALRPFVFITATALAMGGLLLASSYFSKGEGASTASTLANQRRAGYGIEGGSNYFLDEAGADAESRSIAQEAALAPIALLTALYRPLIFEARNAVQLLNAIEATALLLLTIQIIRRRGFRNVFNHIRQEPVLTFCAAFVFALALGTGLATSNLGTLSRYRAPMMPFFFALLMLLRQSPVEPGAKSAGVVTPGAAE
ncbi:MAG: hypothetical protein Q8S33_02595 [Myxococcales bacterium]|nr:hypothetical protein [Myxococcales bacterium]